MNNHNSATAYSISTKDNFKMEVITLMKKIHGRIDSSSSKIKLNDKSPSRETAANLSVLKIQVFKLKEILKRVEGMEDKDWNEKKSKLIKDFETAYEVFQPQTLR